MSHRCKKIDPFGKVNYRPVSLLPPVSKVYETINFNQISTYFKPYFSNLLTSFRKNHNTQRSSLKALELWKEALNKGKSVAATFMYLSKAFDNRNHNLLTTKLGAYTAWKLSVLRVILVRIFPHSDWIRRDTFRRKLS